MRPGICTLIDRAEEFIWIGWARILACITGTVDQELLFQVQVIFKRHIHATQVHEYFFGFFALAANDNGTAHLAAFDALGPGGAGNAEIVADRQLKEGGKGVDGKGIAGRRSSDIVRC